MLSAIAEPAPGTNRLTRRAEIVRRLGSEILHYVQDLGMSRTPAITAGALTHPIRAVWHFSELADLAPTIASQRQRVAQLPQPYRAGISACEAVLRTQGRAAKLAFADPSQRPPEDEDFETIYQSTKSGILLAASDGRLRAEQAELALDLLAELKSAARHLDRASKRYAALAVATQIETHALPGTSGAEIRTDV